ncbi:PQQ-binding-like beta-propeller repeat protein [Geoalkalibacter halelectricus]|uniref:outer membrane protein assembly factor BamB family protein n=1 Tax=Geoalkalibacter halelectricus TaxID=2847045 RepID=UPI003D1FA0A8
MRGWWILILLVGLSGCALPRAGEAPEPEPLVLGNTLIDEDTLWSGQVLIDGWVKVARGVTLTIAPGTEVAFVRRDLTLDGLGDATIDVDGRLIARGTRDAPIVFRSAEASPQAGDWLEIQSNFSPEVHLQYCEIRDSAHGIHAHFTRGVIEDCIIRNNIDGTRIGNSRFVIRNNLVEHNISKGINFRDSRIEVTRNIFRYNPAGIFLFELDRDSPIHQNNFYANEYHFRLGDFFTGDVYPRDNWWGSADPAVIAAHIYDSRMDDEVGTVTPAPAPGWRAGSGPRDALDLVPVASYSTAGFVDAPPLVAGDRLLVASWDGTLSALDAQGRQVWRRQLGEVLDAPLAADGERIYGQSWKPEVFALRLRDGRPLWRFPYAPSPADDHRQGGVVLLDDLVLVPAWNGTLHALDKLTGTPRWSFDSGAALRAAPALDEERIYLADTGGRLSALDLQGQLLWQWAGDEPLLAVPQLIPQGVVVLGRGGTLRAFSRDGEILWQQELNETCFYAAPVPVDTTLVVATAGSGLWRLSAATGEVIWRAQLSGPSYATPLVHRGRIFVGDNDGTLEIFGLDGGDSLARTTVSGAIQGAPAIFQDHLVFGARDGALHRLRIEDRLP